MHLDAHIDDNIRGIDSSRDAIQDRETKIAEEQPKKASIQRELKDLEAKGMIFVEEKDGLDVNAFRTSVLAQVNKDFPDWTGYIEQIRAVK